MYLCIVLYYSLLYLYCIVLYYTVLYSIILYFTIFYCIVLYCIVLYCTLLYLLYYIVLYYTVLYLYYIVLVLYYTVLYCIILYSSDIMILWMTLEQQIKVATFAAPNITCWRSVQYLFWFCITSDQAHRLPLPPPAIATPCITSLIPSPSICPVTCTANIVRSGVRLCPWQRFGRRTSDR